jgi:aspartyl-tRNA(Asn)/glutamyl-tRNA(Gln) amidotransferase subunit A
VSPGPGPTIADAAHRLARGEVRSETLTEECLSRIAALNRELNAFINVTAEQALADARLADREIGGGRYRGPLHGIPISLKDLIDQAGLPTTAASRVRAGHLALSDAPVTARLRDAGVVFVGKTNLHEFAFGTTNEDSAFGPARNPVDPTRSPGGSSGGSAVAVATGMSLGSIGTDTGGSIRIPAAACGIVGLKPAWNELPAAHVVPLSRQLDHVGPLARTVTDAWLLYEGMRGFPREVGETLQGVPLADLRVGLLSGYFFDAIDEGVEMVVLATIERLRRAGTSVSELGVAHAGEIAPVYLHLVLADGAAYHGPTLERRPQDYTPNVRLRLEMGRYVLAEDYARALLGRAVLTSEVDRLLTEVDVLALPALAIPAPPIGDALVKVKGGGQEPVRNIMLRCTQPFNLTGHPAISIPCGSTPEGLPVGLQLVGRLGGTPALLCIARAIEGLLEYRP